MPDETQMFSQNSNPQGVHRRRISTWVALGVILIAAIGVGIWAWLGSQTENPSGPAAPNEFEGWQTFRSDEHGFEVRYPGNGSLIDNSTEFYIRVPGGGDSSAGTLWVMILRSSAEKSPKSMMAERLLTDPQQNLNWQASTFAGKTAEMANFVTPGYSGGTGKVYVLTHNGKNFGIVQTVVDLTRSPDLTSLTNKILSTFKFTK